MRRYSKSRQVKRTFQMLCYSPRVPIVMIATGQYDTCLNYSS